MNFRICISLFLLCCLLQPSTAQKPVTKPKEVTVKAMTYNTYSGRKQGIDKIAEVIKKENPDIVSLQEIERNTEINPWDTPKKLSELTGMKYYYFAHALDIPTGGDYGNVILSKYPVSEEKSFKLSVLKEGDYVRSFGYVKVVKEGKEFYFATTHLDHKYEDAARLKQVDEILACVEHLDKPVILGGDLNSRRGSATMAAFQKYFTVNCLSDGAPWTVPVPSPAYACDWLIYAPNEAFTVKAYNVCYWADKESDHYPVVATYPFYFATTHLDHKYEDAARLKQVDEILACVEHLDKPVILGGDLNSRRGSATMAAFQKYFTVNCLSDGAPWTVPVPSPAYACDWLIYAPNEAFTVKAYNVCYWADKESDHYPVVATYLIK